MTIQESRVVEIKHELSNIAELIKFTSQLNASSLLLRELEKATVLAEELHSIKYGV
jgi:hypothetical protein